MAELERFVEAQNADAAFESALAEIRAGRKTSHWIRFVFPQLAGLGTSPTSRFYALDGRGEAERYLRHPVLGPRLLAITTAVVEHLRAGRQLEVLMGSRIDAAKTVSSMTLFAEVVGEGSPGDQSATLSRLAREVLALAETQGLPPCRFTRSRLQA